MPHRALLPRRRSAVRAPSPPRLLGLTTAVALSLFTARAVAAQNLEDAEMLKRHEVHATVMWKKLEALVEGARLASRALWQRAA